MVAPAPEDAIFAVIELCVLVALIVLAVTRLAAIRRCRTAYSLQAASCSSRCPAPILTFPLRFDPPLRLVCFPCFMALGLGRPTCRRRDTIVVVLFAVGLLLAVGRWAGGVWVS